MTKFDKNNFEYEIGGIESCPIDYYFFKNDESDDATTADDSVKAEDSSSGDVVVEEDVSSSTADDSVKAEDSSSENEDEKKIEQKLEDSTNIESNLEPEESAHLAMQTSILQTTYSDLRKDLPDFRSGDTISVGYRVIEGSRSRVQNFEGVVIKISSGHGLDKTFTVRKVSGGIGVERIFPFHSPNIDSIIVLKEGKVRRAKLYYMRGLKGKATRIKEKIK